MGEIATRLADKVIITAEDPRTESLDTIYNDIVSNITPKPPLKLRGGAEGRGVIRVDDRQKAISEAIKLAKKGDIVVATGKGHEKSMCFGTTEYPWSDREAIEKAIKNYGV
jgi:UDP-N-acetylmuramoyl-L-alanyl-D-glutamate--2,6-diaminopimelate ligase